MVNIVIVQIVQRKRNKFYKTICYYKILKKKNKIDFLIKNEFFKTKLWIKLILFN